MTRKEKAKKYLMPLVPTVLLNKNISTVERVDPIVQVMVNFSNQENAELIELLKKSIKRIESKLQKSK